MEVEFKLIRKCSYFFLLHQLIVSYYLAHFMNIGVCLIHDPAKIS